MESVKNVGVVYELGNINELSSYMKNYKSIAKMNDKDYITNSDLNMETMSKKYANYYKKMLDGNK